MREEDKEGKL